MKILRVVKKYTKLSLFLDVSKTNNHTHRHTQSVILCTKQKSLLDALQSEKSSLYALTLTLSNPSVTNGEHFDIAWRKVWSCRCVSQQELMTRGGRVWCKAGDSQPSNIPSIHLSPSLFICIPLLLFLSLFCSLFLFFSSISPYLCKNFALLSSTFMKL